MSFEPCSKCTHLQLVEPIRVIHLVTEQRTGECNVIDIHSCNRLVHTEKNLKLQMPLCIPLKDKTKIIRDKTLLSIVPGSTKKSNTILPTACSFPCWIRTKLVVWLPWISFGVILCSVDHRRQLHNRRCIWHKVGGSEARKPRSLKSGGLKPSSLTELYAYDSISGTIYF